MEDGKMVRWRMDGDVSSARPRRYGLHAHLTAFAQGAPTGTARYSKHTAQYCSSVMRWFMIWIMQWLLGPVAVRTPRVRYATGNAMSYVFEKRETASALAETLQSAVRGLYSRIPWAPRARGQRGAAMGAAGARASHRHAPRASASAVRFRHLRSVREKSTKLQYLSSTSWDAITRPCTHKTHPPLPRHDPCPPRAPRPRCTYSSRRRRKSNYCCTCKRSATCKNARETRRLYCSTL